MLTHSPALASERLDGQSEKPEVEDDFGLSSNTVFGEADEYPVYIELVGSP